MKKLLKEYGLPGFQLLVKIATTLRTGIDTFMVSGAMAVGVTMLSFVSSILYVALIDAVLLGLWLFLAYGGEGRQAQLLRLFAAVGAWILYLGMVWIGWAAHPDAPGLALLGRVAGGLALAYDTYGLLAGPIRSVFIGLYNWVKRRMAGETPEEAYHRMMSKEIVRAIRKTAPTVRKSMVQQIGSRVTMELPDFVDAILPTPEEAMESPNSPAEVPVVYQGLRSTIALQQQWNTCKEAFTPGQTFTRADIEQCSTLAKSRANDVLGYAVGIGDAVKQRHGLYLYNPRLEFAEKPMVITSDPAELPEQPKPEGDF